MVRLQSGYVMGGWLPAALPVGGDLGAPPPPAAGTDAAFMHLALVEAMRGVGLPSPNPNVGCVLVKDGAVLAAGATERFGGRHGERRALDALAGAGAARGATAYVLLEPCSHVGKQPPCADALISAGIARCVVAVPDPHPLVAGEGLRKLGAAGIRVDVGTLGAEAACWNLPFLHDVAYGRPLVVGKWAQTLNGQLADSGGGSQWISGPAARSYAHWLRLRYDAVLVGAGTLLADAPALTARDTPLPAQRQPLKIVFDPGMRLLPAGPDARLLRTTFAGPGRVVVARPRGAPALAGLAGGDVYYVELDGRAGSFEQLLAELRSARFVAWHGTYVQSVLVEGGPRLLNHLLAADRLDAFHVVVTPSFLAASGFGIGASFAAESAPGLGRCADMRRYELVATAQLGADALLEFLPLDRARRLVGT